MVTWKILDAERAEVLDVRVLDGILIIGHYSGKPWKKQVDLLIEEKVIKKIPEKVEKWERIK